MTQKITTRLATALLIGVTMAGCEQLPTEPNAALQSQLVLRSSSSLNASLQAVAFDLQTDSAVSERKPEGQRNGPVDPSTISTVEVKITRIALLTSGPVPEATDSTETAAQRWVDLELDFNPDSTWFNLKTLAADSTLGTVPDSVTGEIRAIRIYFGEGQVLFKDGTKEALRIPRGQITIPTRGVTVNDGNDIAVVFETLASFGRIIRTGDGLIMTPAFAAQNGGPSKGRGESKGKGREKGNNGRSKR